MIAADPSNEIIIHIACELIEDELDRLPLEFNIGAQTFIRQLQIMVKSQNQFGLIVWKFLLGL